MEIGLLVLVAVGFALFLVWAGGGPPDRTRQFPPDLPPRTSSPPRVIPPEGRRRVTPLVRPAKSEVTGNCYVVDGDSIVINKINIRLFGIDAPELNHPYGKNAKWELLALCKGQRITARFTDDWTYDRAVARCYLPAGTDLSAEMVRRGHAVDWPKYSGGVYRAYEVPDIRQRLWRCDARQKGRMPPGR